MAFVGDHFKREPVPEFPVELQENFLRLVVCVTQRTHVDRAADVAQPLDRRIRRILERAENEREVGCQPSFLDLPDHLLGAPVIPEDGIHENGRVPFVIFGERLVDGCRLAASHASCHENHRPAIGGVRVL